MTFYCLFYPYYYVVRTVIYLVVIRVRWLGTGFQIRTFPTFGVVINRGVRCKKNGKLSLLLLYLFGVMMGSDENFEISTKKSSASPQRSHDLICLVSRTGDVVMVIILEVGVSQKVQYFLFPIVQPTQAPCTMYVHTLFSSLFSTDINLQHELPTTMALIQSHFLLF